MSHKTEKTIIGSLVPLLFLLSLLSNAQDYSPNVGPSYPHKVYWGDTHVHTNMSLDANGVGNKALTPDHAYRYAKGEEIRTNSGQAARLARPLDFLVVADHAENMGVMPGLESGDPRLLNTETGKRWYQLMKEHPFKLGEVLALKQPDAFNKAKNFRFSKDQPGSFFYPGFQKEGIESKFGRTVGYVGDEAFRRSVWDDVIANAERHNQPGIFTAFVGYEWTSSGKPLIPNTIPKPLGNLDRVVIFKDGVSEAGRVLPFSGIDSQNPEDLWDYMAAYEQKTGGEILAIPHNGNASNGGMFALNDWGGAPLSSAYAAMRSRWEPLYEVTQIKGDGEAHPVLSPTDQFSDFEKWHNNGGANPTDEGTRTPEWEKRKVFEYARSALKLGLAQQSELGINPFKYGLIGSTDAHTSITGAAENNFWGKLSLLEPSSFRLVDEWFYSAGGFAAVWAQDNTRASLFAAMKRKEVYATTGPRMTVRFFGGWDYQEGDAVSPELASMGYKKGVPMGGDLSQAPQGKSPTFLIRAVRDPEGANLDRIQIIKGWHDKNGELHEKIYHVALSDNRQVNQKGEVKPVGSTVDVADASYTNTIGAPELAVVWRDPDFDKDELAFYYVRVLEIPTPRWTAYDAKYFGLKDIPEEVPMVIQERAYTSPIWYSPPAKAGGE